METQFTEKSVTTFPFHATVEYRLNGKSYKIPFMLAVAADATPADRVGALKTYARKYFAGEGVSMLTVVYRQDGQDKPLTYWEKFTDILRRLTLRGEVIERQLYVPIWPRPKALNQLRSS